MFGFWFGGGEREMRRGFCRAVFTWCGRVKGEERGEKVRGEGKSGFEDGCEGRWLCEDGGLDL